MDEEMNNVMSAWMDEHMRGWWTSGMRSVESRLSTVWTATAEDGRFTGLVRRAGVLDDVGVDAQAPLEG
jgi:hypothetical protein